jgi:hypothetical protein
VSPAIALAASPGLLGEIPASMYGPIRGDLARHFILNSSLNSGNVSNANGIIGEDMSA